MESRPFDSMDNTFPPLETLEDVSYYLHGNRKTANNLLCFIVEEGPRTDVEKQIGKIILDERHHIKFVKSVMNELTASEDSDHDWSKDEVYMVIIALRYLLGRGDLVEDICEREIEHHYRHEIHLHL